MMPRASLFAAWATVVIAATVAAAGSSSEGPTLAWHAPAECSGADALRARVEQLLSRPWGELEAELVIEARVERLDGSWTLELSVSRDGQPLAPRRVAGESCAALIDAGAAIVALIVERELATREEAEPEATASFELPPPRRAPGPASTPAPAVSEPILESSSAREAGVASPPLPRRARPRRALIELAGGVDATSLPRAAVGGRVGAGFGQRRWLAAASMLGLLPVREALDVPSGARARFWLVVGQLRACHTLGRSTLRLDSCATFEGGWLRGESDGVDRTGAGGADWWALGPELGLVVGHARRLYLGVSAQVPLNRPDFVIVDDTTGQRLGLAHRPPAASVRGLVGYRFVP